MRPSVLDLGGVLVREPTAGHLAALSGRLEAIRCTGVEAPRSELAAPFDVAVPLPAGAGVRA